MLPDPQQYINKEYDKIKSFIGTTRIEEIEEIIFSLMKEYGKLMWNTAVERAAENATTKVVKVYNGGLNPDSIYMYDDHIEVDKDSILNNKI